MGKITVESKKIGIKLRQLRLKKRISQEELAYKSGLNRAYIGYIERGERNPSTETLSKIARSLKVKFYEIFHF